MSAQRYSIDTGPPWDERLQVAPDPDGEWVRAEDYDRERRRWVVARMKTRSWALCKESRLWARISEETEPGQALIFLQLAAGCMRRVSRINALRDAIERGDRLEYFERLSEVKGDE